MQIVETVTLPISKSYHPSITRSVGRRSATGKTKKVSSASNIYTTTPLTALLQEARLYPITPSTERGRRLRQIRATGDVSVEAVY